MRRIVIDTNVLVSSLFGGRPREVMDLWRDQRVTLCLSDEIVAEYLEVLARFGDVAGEVRELIGMLSERENVVFVTPSECIHEVSADPADDRFLECAVAAEAQVIVSGDRHLLALEEFRGVLVMGPAAFMAWVEGS